MAISSKAKVFLLGGTVHMRNSAVDGLAARCPSVEVFVPIENVQGFENISPAAAYRTNITTIEECDCIIAFWDDEDPDLLFTLGTAHGLRKDLVILSGEMTPTLSRIKSGTLAVIPYTNKENAIEDLTFLLKIVAPHYIRRTPLDDWLLPVAEALQSRWSFEKEN